MLFMYVHTHTPDKCIADQPQELLRLFSAVREGCQCGGVKVVSAHAAAHEHTFFWLLDSDDIGALEAAIRPMTVFGVGHLIPVQTQGYMKA